MPASPDDLFAYLDRLGIPHQTVTHPPLFTVEQSRALRGQIAGGHTKNLFLRDKKAALSWWSLSKTPPIALKCLHRRLGATGRFSFGSADLMRETSGRGARLGDARSPPSMTAAAASPSCSTPP